MNTDFLIELITVYGVQLLGAVVVLIIGFWLSSYAGRIVVRILKKRQIDAALITFTGSFVNIAIKTLVVLSVLSMVGIQIMSFVAVLGAAGLAIGFALQGSLSNFAGGVMILLFKPFKVGDFIDAQGFTGTVKEIQIFNTVLHTPDNKKVIIPNGALANGPITNVTTEDTRRVDWTFGIAYGTDYETAENIILEVLKKDPRIFDDPAPFTGLVEMADSSVNIVTRVWTKTQDFWGVYFDINKTIYKTFNEKGIEIPFPQMDVYVKSN